MLVLHACLFGSTNNKFFVVFFFYYKLFQNDQLLLKEPHGQCNIPPITTTGNNELHVNLKKQKK